MIKRKRERERERERERRRERKRERERERERESENEKEREGERGREREREGGRERERESRGHSAAPTSPLSAQHAEAGGSSVSHQWFRSLGCVASTSRQDDAAHGSEAACTTWIRRPNS